MGWRKFLLLAALHLALRASAGTTEFPEFTIDTARDYLQAVSQSPQLQIADPVASRFLQAKLQSQLGRQDEAERSARQALEHDPKRSDIHSFLADLFIRQDRLEEASRCLRSALASDPALAGGQRRLGMILDRLGDRDGARYSFAKAIALNPQDATARLLLGRLLLDQGSIREAALHLERACQLDPESANAFYALSQAQTRLGQHEAVRDTLKRFQELKRKERTALDAENATHDDGEALRVVAAGFHTDAALLFLQQRQEALAEAHLRQAMLLAPSNASSCERLAAFYVERGRLPEARRICDELVRRWPKEAAYRVNLGTLLLQLKDASAAVEQLNRALELNPKQPEALNNLVRYYLGGRTNLAEALALSRRFVEVQPTGANYDLLGWALYANGQIAEARAASARAVELEPNNAVFRERNQRLQRIPSAQSGEAGRSK